MADQLHVIQQQDAYNCSFFFNSKAFLAINNELKPITFQLKKKDEVIGVIHFSIINNTAISLQQTPFGGVDVTSGVSESDLLFFLEQVLLVLKKRTISSVELRLPPVSYFPSLIVLQETVLQQVGFKTITQEINCHLTVSTSTTFWSMLHASEKNKRNKCFKKGFTVQELSKLAFDTVYDLIAENRKMKGYPMTMARERLKNVVTSFNEYHLFGCFDGDKLIACTVSIEVNSSILYNFYMADSMSYRSFSPLVFLNEYVYNWCVSNQFTQLDLGTVSVDGVINEGLFSFKKNIGAQVSLKSKFLLTW